LAEVLDSDDRIPYVTRRGEQLYNFWTDETSPQGIWRRTTAADYLRDVPEWEVLIDVDALSAQDGVTWVWAGARVLRPEMTRALVFLSPGGSDATVVREFDLTSLDFVDEGFALPESRHAVDWIDEDTVLVGTDLGPGSMTESGYPRTVREWRRGTPVADAPVVYESEPDAIGPVGWVDRTPGFERQFVTNRLDFYTTEVFRRSTSAGLERLEIPADAEMDVHREWLVLRLRTPWTVDGMTYSAGALIATHFENFVAGERKFTTVFEPEQHSSLEDHVWTRRYLLLTVLRDVRSTVWVLDPSHDWARRPLAVSGELDTHDITGTQESLDDEFLLNSSGFSKPATLRHGNAENTDELTEWKKAPDFFDVDGIEVRQFFADSADGTPIPYFVVGGRTPAPTLLSAYGGFEISRLPGYSGVIGRGWLARGGTYVVANIRGGGEYGPDWHSSGVKTNRLKVYEDLAAVAGDLVARGITTRERLGMEGGSNGGLLAGVMLTKYPELFGAIVSQVPLLDMMRYHQLLAGASWIAEYGDPRIQEERDYLLRYSPYQNVHSGPKYPPVLFTTSTRDDRVHPGHARKMVAKMLEQGHDVWYFENIEGGHGGAADNAQRASKWAMVFDFLWHHLSPRPTE
jgi:prolyl oligopeptidase